MIAISKKRRDEIVSLLSSLASSSRDNDIKAQNERRKAKKIIKYLTTRNNG